MQQRRKMTAGLRDTGRWEWYGQTRLTLKSTGDTEVRHSQGDFSIIGKNVEYHAIDILPKLVQRIRKYPVVLGTVYVATLCDLFDALLEEGRKVGLILQRYGSWIPEMNVSLQELEDEKQAYTKKREKLESIRSNAEVVLKKVLSLEDRGLHADMLPWTTIQQCVTQDGNEITDLPGVVCTGRPGSADCHDKTFLLCDVIGGRVIPREGWVCTANQTKAALTAWNSAVVVKRGEPEVLLGMLQTWADRFCFCAPIWTPLNQPAEPQWLLK